MINEQLSLIIASFIAGAVIMFMYDILIIFREVLRTPFMFTAISDVLFWFGAGVSVFYVIYVYNEGSIRMYSLVFLFGGMGLLQWTIGRKMVRLVIKILTGIRKCLKNVFSHCRMVLRRCFVNISFIGSDKE